MDNVASLIESLGGNASFGDMVGIPASHVRVMKRRGSIPVRYWSKVIEGAKSTGEPISYEKLVQIHAPATSASMRGE